MTTQMNTSKRIVRLSLISASMVLLHMLIPVQALAADCTLSANAQLPSCKNALTEPNIGGSMQETSQDLSWVQKNAGRNAAPNTGANQAQPKGMRQWTRTVRSKCVKGSLTLNLTEGATCPAGFSKKQR